MLLAEQASVVGAITAVAVTAGILAQIILQIMTRASIRAADKKADLAAKWAAIHAKDVEVALKKTDDTVATKLEEIAKVADATHLLVNSAMGAQKRLLATTARALADRTGNREDIKAAELAEKESADHEAKQVVVDKKSEETLIPRPPPARPPSRKEG